MKINPKPSTKFILSDEVRTDLKNLVLARIKTASEDLGVAIGSTELSKQEMLEKVNKEDKMGQEIMNIHLEYLRDMASGAIYQSSNAG